MPEGLIDCDETLDALIELHHLASTWTEAIAKCRFLVDGKTGEPVLLGEVLPHYGHPMAAQVSGETDLSLVRSGPLKDDFNLLAWPIFDKDNRW